jgi:pimeloyl-ACP methyl ester carboxylesterase
MDIYNQENNTLIKRIGGDDDEKVFDLAVEILERIARWEKSLALDNRNTLFNRNAFGITAKNTDSGKVLSTGLLDPSNPNTEVINVQVNKNLNGQYILPIDLELKNATTATLFYKALYFSRAYEVMSLNGDYLTVDEIPAQDQFFQPNALEFGLPDGKTERVEIVKFIVSTSRINEEFLLEQDALEKLGETVEFWKERGRGVDLLAGDRDLIKKNQDKKAPANDWFCKTLVFKLSPASNEIGKNAVPIGNGKIVIKGHDTFKAKVALSAAGNATRDLNSAAPLPQIFGWKNLLALDTPSRDLTTATPDTLEIISPENEDSLRDNPLQIELDVQLKEGEYILPLTFDGEDFIPIGEARSGANGKVEVSIHSLPEEAAKTRSLVRAIKMCFFKVALGVENQNKLCWIEYTGEKPIYHDTGVKDKVAKAKNILLVIHGIVGNTSEMTAAMQQALNNKLVDLVLAYDYENLNSTIESNAGKLKDALANVGIKPDKKGKFNKKFSILAHSMGGLVSRYYIEHLAGNEVVAKLILAGTPNGGSNLSVVAKYRDTALFLLPFAVNLGLAIPGIASILGILNGSKKLTVSLEQMDYNNSGRFLKNLEQSKDPKIPYYVLAGHLDEFLKINVEAKRLVNKIFKGVANTFYVEANDIAVSVKSIKNVPSKRKPAPIFYDIKGHHLNYFLLKESVDKILEILKK